MKAALSPLQGRRMKVLQYLDNWLLCTPSRDWALHNISCLLARVSQLGFKVNLAKSCLIPSQAATFLVVFSDSPSVTAFPVVQRVNNILQYLSQSLGRQLLYIAVVDHIEYHGGTNSAQPLKLT